MEEQQGLDREEVISLIASQLRYYGYTETAQSLAEESNIPMDLGTSAELSELLYSATYSSKDEEDDGDEDEEYEISALVEGSPYSDEDAQSEDFPSKCLADLDPETNYEPKPTPNYNLWYITTHRAAATCVRFKKDGKFAATGSADSSLKVLDTSKMKSHSDEDRPVIRTLYDHTGRVNDLSFHPNGLTLASCSDDRNIKLFDIATQGIKRSFRFLRDKYPVRSIDFHPTGEYMLAGTDHEAIRFWDVQNIKCYIPSSSQSNHRLSITKVRWNSNGGQFVSSSLDGTIKIWEGEHGECIQTIDNAHNGQAVSSVEFSKSGAYILSSGCDSTSKLWDANNGKCIVTFEGAIHRNNHVQTTFLFEEDYIISSDENDNSIVCWDSRTGKLLIRHTGIVRYVAASPTESGFMSCADDFRVRYWNLDPTTQS
ncbi:1925_t:CDS:10 [Funneliformis caledonium]|uniref:Cleavage stimulation factor 50 kDa subunit n=2 Tax=Funneliformis TaxID=1117308 RepID=A0A9N8WGX4_9GLOM|nr:1925_t:CDS:10 [Funneliformis caledonium]CAG8514988.1 904_t:CDS:10 [Funneliformis mosseae]